MSSINEHRTVSTGDGEDISKQLARAIKATAPVKNYSAYSSLFDDSLFANIKVSYADDLKKVCLASEKDIRTFPDTACSHMRGALEILVSSILESHNIILDNTKMDDKKNGKLFLGIEKLAETGITPRGGLVNRCMNSLRILGNKSTHKDGEYYLVMGEYEACLVDVLMYITITRFFSVKSLLTKAEEAAVVSCGEYINKIFSHAYRSNDATMIYPDQRLAKNRVKYPTNILRIFKNLPIDNLKIMKVYTKYSYEDEIGQYFYKAVQIVDDSAYSILIPVRKTDFTSSTSSTASHRENKVLTTFGALDVPFDGILSGRTIETGAGMSWNYTQYTINANTEPLSAYVEKNPLGKRETLQIVLCITNTLESIKNLSYHHRSITPHAVFVTKADDIVKAQLGELNSMKVDNVSNNTTTITPEILARVKKTKTFFLYYSANPISEAQMMRFTDAQWQRVDVYSLIVIIAYCLDGKSGNNAVALNTYCSFSEEFSTFCQNAMQSSLNEIPDLDDLKIEVEAELEKLGNE